MKLGSDPLGITLGLLTIPMAVFSSASLIAGILLALWQDWPALWFGIGAFLICSVLARVLEQLVIVIDDAAISARRGHKRARAYTIAAISGALPVLVVYCAAIYSFRQVLGWPTSAPIWVLWLWGYGVALGPWSLYAERVSRFRRTLVGMRAYAGHVGMWLFLLLTAWFAVPPAVIVAAMMVPAILPFTLGMTLALADREAIANVRV